MNAALVEQARALQTEGLTLRAIAERLNVSHTQVARLLRSPVTTEPAAPTGDAAFMAGLRGTGDEEPEVADDEPADDNTTEPTDVGDELAWLHGMQRRAMARADRFERAGDYTASQRAARDAAVLAPVIMRAERERKTQDGMLTYSLADADAGCAALDARAKKVEDQGLTCSECGRAMRRRLAEGRP